MAADLFDDVLPGEARCVHGMLTWPDKGISTYAYCKGLRDVPPEADVLLPPEDDPRELQWWKVADSERVECVVCDRRLNAGQRFAYSHQHDGSICESCAVAA